MGIFGKSKSNEEKQKELFEKYGLDIDSYDDQKIKEKNAKNLHQIAEDLFLSGLNKFGMGLTMSIPDHAKVQYLSAIFESNLIIIRQNELILRALMKIADKK
ncbi:MAG: hypothetical protein M1511_12610 [Deltaproteobacteria bacterium]|nr:hypothetical protein [Deltaproteobacteria bacterium]